LGEDNMFGWMIVGVALIGLGAVSPAQGSEGSVAESNVTEQYPVVIDGFGTSLMGSRNIGSSVRGLNRFFDLSFDMLPELSPIAGVSIRLGRFILLDAPLSFLAIWIQHEVFGHGARAREFGLNPTFHIATPPPYNFDLHGKNRANWEYKANLSLEQDVLLITEGPESEELLMKELVNQAILSKRWHRILDTIIFVHLLGDLARFSIEEENDVDNYRQAVNMDFRTSWKFTPQWPIFVKWGLDPILWWALYDYFYSGIILGESPTSPPLLSIGAVDLLPRPQMRLSAWGEELGLSVSMASKGILSEAEFFVGPRDGNPSFFFMSSATFFDLSDRFDLGGRLGMWLQPEPLRWSTIGCTTQEACSSGPDLKAGGFVELEFSIHIFKGGSIFGMIGLKSYGYAVGRQLNAGVYGQGGLLLKT
jgi:hypothetical protein